MHNACGVCSLRQVVISNLNLLPSLCGVSVITVLLEYSSTSMQGEVTSRLQVRPDILIIALKFYLTGMGRIVSL